MKKRLIVIGGGASGFFCAVNAKSLNPALEVIILEKTSKILAKVRISGGGRCNVTHECFELPVMAKRYPRGQNVVKKSFHQFFTTDTIKWFEERGVSLKAEADGRMFPVTNSSQTIIDCLVREMNKTGVQLLYNKEVRGLRPIRRPAGKHAPSATAISTNLVDPHLPFTGSEDKLSSTLEGSHGVLHSGEVQREAGAPVTQASGDGDRHPQRSKEEIGWEVICADGSMHCDYVCVACGGYPKAASFNWLAELGHQIEPPVPSLFTFNMPGHPITGLMGVSVESAQVKITGSKLQETGPLLITHWGLSGPAVLKLSAWGARMLADVDYQFRVQINWLPGQNDQSVREIFHSLRENSASQKIVTRNPFGLPQRLWMFLLHEAGCKEEWRWADLPSANQNRLINLLVANEYAVSGKTTFKEEFVTAGGVDLSEVNANTMESKLCTQLYFAGEVMNVDGITGGYNFQHAWTSGYIAAKAIAARALADVLAGSVREGL